MTPFIVVSTLACFAVSGAVTSSLLCRPLCREQSAPYYRLRQLSPSVVLAFRSSRPTHLLARGRALQSIPAIEQQLDASLMEVSKTCGFPACSRSFLVL